MRFSSRRSPGRGGVPSGTRLPLRLGIAGAVALSALLLGGCVQPAPVKTPQAHATVKPLFASDADALAAATKAYAAYLKMSDTILSEGGAGADRIRSFVSGQALRDELSSSESFKSSGWHLVGSTTFDNATFERQTPDASGVGVVTIYACVDLTNVDVLNSSGQSVVSSSRPDRQAFEISFDSTKGDPRGLLVSSTDAWSGGGVCPAGS